MSFNADHLDLLCWPEGLCSWTVTCKIRLPPRYYLRNTFVWQHRINRLF